MDGEDNIADMSYLLDAPAGKNGFVRIENGIVFVKMLGACVGCASVDVTLTEAIETIILEEVPGIIGVEQVFDDF